MRLPSTIHITIQFPTMAIKSIIPNNMVHNDFVPIDISYGLSFGVGFKQSAMKSLQINEIIND